MTDKKWTHWKTPKMKGYRAKCCDCGLVHEFNFRVYKIIKLYPDGEKDVDIMDSSYGIQIKARRVEP